MTDEWVNRIYNTQTGIFQADLPVGSASWASHLTGQGDATHTVHAYNSGISQSLLDELCRGNAYTITQEWAPTGFIAYAGVIQDNEWNDTARTIDVNSVEFRGAYLNDRMLYGVPDYEAYGGDTNILTLSGRSRPAAARHVINLGTSYNSEWYFPIDVPADASGSFSADWKYNERLKIEDHLQQIEDDGCEIFFRPYLDGGGNLRWAMEVGVPTLGLGSETTFDIRGPSSPVKNLKVRKDFVKQMTGVLAFGEGGKSAPNKWAGVGAALHGIGVRDTWIEFPDVQSADRLQDAADHTYNSLKDPTEVWSFDLEIYPGGPAYAAPGRLLGPIVPSGHERLPAGTRHMRTVALSGSMGFTVTPEVQ